MVNLSLSIDKIQLNDIKILIMINESGSDLLPDSVYELHRELIESQLHTSGVIVLRGFKVDNAERLRHFASLTSPGLWRYLNGNSPRRAVLEGVYTASDYPQNLEISLHSELSYARRWPQRIYFGCTRVADSGGVLCIADARSIFDRMPQHVIDIFTNRGGVRYRRVLPSRPGLGRTWQETFESHSLDEVQQFCERQGIELSLEEQDCIFLTNVGPLSIIDPLSGRHIWFNQAEQFHPSSLPPQFFSSLMAMYKGRENLLPQNALFGDGTEIPDHILTTIRQVLHECRRTLPWQRNDVAVLNNNIIAHGRLPYTGARELYAVLTK